MAMKSAHFKLYRYQLLPQDRFFQADLLGYKSMEEVLAQKNIIFAEALRQVTNFRSSNTYFATELLWHRDDFYLYRVAADRSLTRETRDFKKETLDNWPSVLVAVWNAPDKQLIAVQRRTNAFQHSEVVVNAILDTIAPRLRGVQLTAVWEPLFDRQEFWQLVNHYSNKLAEIEFELVTPNMANISKVLPENLREFAKNTNAIKSKIAIESDPTSSLKIEKTNATLNGLVDYASEGGGNIKVRVSGLRKKLETSRTVKEVEVDELDLEGEPDKIAQVLRKLLE